MTMTKYPRKVFALRQIKGAEIPVLKEGARKPPPGMLGLSGRSGRRHGLIDVFLLCRMHAHQSLDRLDHPLGIVQQIAVNLLRTQIFDHAGRAGARDAGFRGAPGSWRKGHGSPRESWRAARPRENMRCGMQAKALTHRTISRANCVAAFRQARKLKSPLLIPTQIWSAAKSWYRVRDISCGSPCGVLP